MPVMSGNNFALRAIGSAMVLLLLLSACGFTLRSSERITLPLDTIQLQAPSGSPLALQIRRDLEDAGVTVLDATEPAGSEHHLLALSAEQQGQQTLSVGTQTRGAQYNITLSVTANLLYDGELLAGPETLAIERRYNEDIANIGSSSQERDLLLTEMRQALAQQVLRRLQTL